MADLILGPPNLNFKEQLSLLSIDGLDTKDLTNDDIASEHYATFGMTVFPFGHFYTSEGRNFAGENDHFLIQMYHKNNFDYESISFGMGATHLGTMLHFVQFTKDKNLAHLERDFIANYLLSWIRPFTIAVNEIDSIFSTIVYEIEYDLLNEWQGLNGAEHVDEIRFQLPKFDIHKDLLENEKTSLKDIGDYLITPANVGFFLSKPTLISFAQKLNIPIGFGDRSLIIGDIMREASNYEVLNEFSNMLLTYCDYLQSAHNRFPIEPITQAWTYRISETKRLIHAVKMNLLP